MSPFSFHEAVEYEFGISRRHGIACLARLGARPAPRIRPAWRCRDLPACPRAICTLATPASRREFGLRDRRQCPGACSAERPNMLLGPRSTTHGHPLPTRRSAATAQAVASRLAMPTMTGWPHFCCSFVDHQPCPRCPRAGAWAERQHQAHRMGRPRLGECSPSWRAHIDRERKRGDAAQAKPDVQPPSSPADSKRSIVLYIAVRSDSGSIAQFMEVWHNAEVGHVSRRSVRSVSDCRYSRPSRSSGIAGEWESTIGNGQSHVICFPTDVTFGPKHIVLQQLSKLPGANCTFTTWSTAGNVTTYAMQCMIWSAAP